MPPEILAAGFVGLAILAALLARIVHRSHRAYLAEPCEHDRTQGSCGKCRAEESW
jgi:hypothetical protein